MIHSNRDLLLSNKILPCKTTYTKKQLRINQILNNGVHKNSDEIFTYKTRGLENCFVPLN